MYNFNDLREKSKVAREAISFMDMVADHETDIRSSIERSIESTGTRREMAVEKLYHAEEKMRSVNGTANTVYANRCRSMYNEAKYELGAISLDNDLFYMLYKSMQEGISDARASINNLVTEIEAERTPAGSAAFMLRIKNAIRHIDRIQLILSDYEIDHPTLCNS